MNWIVLIVAGLFEVVWAVGLKYTEGFTRPLPTVVTVVAMGLSFYLLSWALRELPLGSAYAVWVGVGAIGTALVGVWLFGEALSPLKVLSLGLIVAGIAGLRVATSAH